MGCLELCLYKPEDAVFSDKINHTPIINGIRLCKAQKYRHKHIDMGNLEAQLSSMNEAYCYR